MISIFYLLSRLPLAWLHALGALLGWLAWLLSPTYRRHMRENMVLALGLKGLFLVLTLLGLGTMWMAVFADVGASLLVVGNGLRLLRK